MVKIYNLAFNYSKRVSLFRNLSLDIEPGRIYGLFGKNGTGKTTLLKLMSGLLKPKAGNCMLNNEQVSKRLPSTMRELFIVPEEFHLPGMDMDEYMKIISPFYPKFNVNRYFEVKEQFELPRKNKINNLSYGQKKKFLLSFGLATNVSMLLLDEPSNGLDIPSKSQLRKAVASSIDKDKCIVISTHQARDLEHLIDSVVILDSGNILINAGYDMIEDKFSFRKVLSLEPGDEIVYSEKITGGYKIISKAKDGVVSMLDLELFFNGVLANSKAFNEVNRNVSCSTYGNNTCFE